MKDSSKGFEFLTEVPNYENTGSHLYDDENDDRKVKDDVEDSDQ